MMPYTVPKRPMKGAAEAMKARNHMSARALCPR